MKKIGPQDKVLHFSFGDEPFGKATVYCGQFTKRQIANKSYKPLDPGVVKLPFKDKSFDVVIATHILQFVNHPMKILEEIKRISKAAHIKEHSDFAEMLFGWNEHRWVINVENNMLIVKEKNDKYGRFGPFFHGLYAEDPVFYDYVAANEGLFKLAVDWYEEDDEITYEEYEEDEFIIGAFEENEEENKEEENDMIILGEIKEEIEEDNQIENNNEQIEEKDKEIEKEENNVEDLFRKIKKKRKIVKTVFRPCQTEYFDLTRMTLGRISDKIDVLNLRKEQLL